MVACRVAITDGITQQNVQRNPPGTLPRHDPVNGYYFMVPSGPGLGMSLDEAKLARNSTETIREAYLDVQRPEWFAQKPAY